MTTQKSFKRLVRSRMESTGESYTAARAALLGVRDRATPTPSAPLATSDASIRERTGRGWEEWFDLLDEWGAIGLSHRDLARRVADELGIDPLAWNAQAVTASYERARGGRAVGQRVDGFAVTASKTVPAAAEQAYDLVVDEVRRSTWLPDAPLAVRTTSRPRSARFDWSDDGTRVHVVLDAKGDTRTTVTIEHSRLPDGDARDRMRTFWREALVALAATAAGR